MSFLFCFVLKGYVPCLSVIQFCAQHAISQKLITFNPSVSEQHGRLGGCSGRESTHSQIKKKKEFPQEIIASTGLLPGGGVLCPGSEEVHQAVKLLWQNHEITTSHVSKRLPLEFAELTERLGESGYIFKVSFEITV